MLVWDQGPYENLRARKGPHSLSMERALEDGLVEVRLYGEKLRAGDLDRPDRLLFDLDPSTDDFEAVREAARAVVTLMDDPALAPDAWHVGDIARRLRRRGDPWQGLGRRATSLTRARERLGAPEA